MPNACPCWECRAEREDDAAFAAELDRAEAEAEERAALLAEWNAEEADTDL